MTYCTLISLFVLYFGFACGERRNVSLPLVNPGCIKGIDCSVPWVVHTLAEGKNDSIHHLWGAAGVPSFLILATDLKTSLTVNWTALNNSLPGSVDFDPDPEQFYGFGVVIPNLILFNDTTDTGKIDGSPNNAKIVVPMTDFKWNITMISNISTLESALIMETTAFRDEELPPDTRISIRMAAFGIDGRSSVLPHLLRTPDSAQLDIVLDHLIMNLSESDAFSTSEEGTGISGFSNARWAMELLIFSTDSSDPDVGDIKLSIQKSLDDEHTPGVFHLDEITTPSSRKASKGGYLQWRPVSYLTPKREIENSTFPNIQTDLIKFTNISDPVKSSLAYALFGEELTKMLMTATTNISFGQPKDKFYSEFKYNTWTVALGYGAPPEESFSSIVIIIISLGMGIPVVMFLIGGIVLATRKCRGSQDELLIN